MATPSEKAQARNEKFLARLQRDLGKKVTLSMLPFDRLDGKTRKQVQGRQSALVQQFRKWAEGRGLKVEVASTTSDTGVRITGRLFDDGREAADRANTIAASAWRKQNGFTETDARSSVFLARRKSAPTAPEAPLLSEFYVGKLNKALASSKLVNLQSTHLPTEKDVERITAYYEDLSALALANNLPVVFKISHGAKSITLMGRHA